MEISQVQLLSEKLLGTGDVWGLRKVMPKSSFDIMYDCLREGRTVAGLSKFEKEIIYNLRRMSVEEIADLPDVSEGLEYSLKNAANSCNTVIELLNLVKTKRFTRNKITKNIIICFTWNYKKRYANFS